MSKEIIHTNDAPKALGPYSQAVVAPTGRLVFLSGQIGIDPKTGELVSAQFEEQAKQAFDNMIAVIHAAGGSLHSIVKLSLFLTDLKNFSIANDMMAELLPQPFPARSTVQVSALPKGASFEVEAIIVV